MRAQSEAGNLPVMPRIFSGIQPSGELHIGNWLGAVQNWVNLQHQLRLSSICVVDLHAITGQVRRTLPSRTRTRDMALGLLACRHRSRARDRSSCSRTCREHAELQWLLNIVTPLGELERMTQFKDKSQRFESVPAGLLQLPGADGGRHPALPRRPGAGGRGPGPAPRADARDRAAVESPSSPDGEAFFPSRKPLLTDGQADHGARWPGQDVEEPGQHDRAAGHARGDLAEAPAGHDRPGPGHAEGSGQARRSATSITSTSTSRRRRRSRRWRRSAAGRGGAASTASGCWPTT